MGTLNRVGIGLLLLMIAAGVSGVLKTQQDYVLFGVIVLIGFLLTIAPSEKE